MAKKINAFKKSSIISDKERQRLAEDNAQRASILITIIVLHNTFGFGKKRINKFIDEYIKFTKQFNSNKENFDKLCKDIWDKFGIKII